MLGGLIGVVFSVLRGPVFSVIEKLISDSALRERLKAEIEAKVIEQQGDIARAQRDVIVAEIGPGSWLTRNWRPCLMYLVMLFLVVHGLLLPLAELIAGRPIPFEPRWKDFPQGLWDLLILGVGGYIGGRSLEKLATTLRPPGGALPPAPRPRPPVSRR